MSGLAICRLIYTELFDCKKQISKFSTYQSYFMLALLKISYLIDILLISKRMRISLLKGFLHCLTSHDVVPWHYDLFYKDNLDLGLGLRFLYLAKILLGSSHTLELSIFCHI